MDRFFSEYFNGKASWRDDFVKGEGYNEAMRCYYAMANSIDEQFGRVVGLLDSLGIADNTIVVFTSDHGEMMTSQGRMFKMIFYDESCRIPFLMRCPGAKTGKTDVCLNTPDIAPTLLGLVGLSDSIPAEMEGDDLSFAVRGGKGQSRLSPLCREWDIPTFGATASNGVPCGINAIPMPAICATVRNCFSTGRKTRI